MIQRSLVAVVAMFLVFMLLFWGSIAFFNWITTVVLLLGLLEFLYMSQTAGKKPMIVLGVIALFLLLLPYLNISQAFHLPAALSLAILVPFLGALIFLKHPNFHLIDSMGTTMLGVFYFGILGSYFYLLRQEGIGPLLVLLGATWATDIGAFFWGTFFGKHKLAPQLSPKKTWEGFYGGIVTSVLGLYFLDKIAVREINFLNLNTVILLGVILAVTGQIGDLMESMIKRSLSAKNSGSIFLSHGGIFDRLDSVLINGMVLFYCLKSMGLH